MLFTLLKNFLNSLRKSAIFVTTLTLLTIISVLLFATLNSIRSNVNGSFYDFKHNHYLHDFTLVKNYDYGRGPYVIANQQISLNKRFYLSFAQSYIFNKTNDVLNFLVTKNTGVAPDSQNSNLNGAVTYNFQAPQSWLLRTETTDGKAKLSLDTEQTITVVRSHQGLAFAGENYELDLRSHSSFTGVKSEIYTYLQQLFNSAVQENGGWFVKVVDYQNKNVSDNGQTSDDVSKVEIAREGLFADYALVPSEQQKAQNAPAWTRAFQLFYQQFIGQTTNQLNQKFLQTQKELFLISNETSEISALLGDVATANENENQPAVVQQIEENGLLRLTNQPFNFSTFRQKFFSKQASQTTATNMSQINLTRRFINQFETSNVNKSEILQRTLLTEIVKLNLWSYEAFIEQEQKVWHLGHLPVRTFQANDVLDDGNQHLYKFVSYNVNAEKINPIDTLKIYEGQNLQNSNNNNELIFDTWINYYRQHLVPPKNVQYNFYKLVASAKHSDLEIQTLFAKAAASIINNFANSDQLNFLTPREQADLRTYLNQIAFQNSFTKNRFQITFNFTQVFYIDLGFGFPVQRFETVPAPASISEITAYMAVVSPIYAANNGLAPLDYQQIQSFNQLIKSQVSEVVLPEIKIKTFVNALPARNKITIQGQSYFIVGTGVSSDLMFPVINFFNLVPNADTQGLVYVNDSGFERSQTVFSTAQNEDFLIGRFNNDFMNQQQTASFLEALGRKLNFPNTEKNFYLISENNFANPSGLRVSFIINFIYALNWIISIVTISIVLLSAFIISIITRNWLKGNINIFGVMEANGTNKKLIIGSTLLFNLVPGLLGGVIGYLISLFIEKPIFSIFASYWFLPIEFSRFNIFYLLLSVVISFVVLSTISLLITFPQLKKNVLRLLKADNNFKLSKLSVKASEYAVFLTPIWKFRFSVLVNSVFRILVLTIISSIMMIIMIFSFNSYGQFNEIFVSDAQANQFNHMIELTTPTTQADEYYPATAYQLGNSLIDRREQMIGGVKYDRQNPLYVASGLFTSGYNDQNNGFTSLEGKPLNYPLTATTTISGIESKTIAEMSSTEQMNYLQKYQQIIRSNPYLQGLWRFKNVEYSNFYVKPLTGNNLKFPENILYRSDFNDSNTNSSNVLSGWYPNWTDAQAMIKRSLQTTINQQDKLVQDLDGNSLFTLDPKTNKPYTISDLVNRNRNYLLPSSSESELSNASLFYLRNKVLVKTLLNHTFRVELNSITQEINVWQVISKLFPPVILNLFDVNEHLFVNAIINSKYGPYFVNNFMTLVQENVPEGVDVYEVQQTVIGDSKNYQFSLSPGRYHLDNTKTAFSNINVGNAADSFNALLTPNFTYTILAILNDPYFYHQPFTPIKTVFNNSLVELDYAKSDLVIDLSGDVTTDYVKYPGLLSNDPKPNFEQLPHGDQTYTYLDVNLDTNVTNNASNNIKIIGLKADPRGSYVKLWNDERLLNHVLYNYQVNDQNPVYPLIANRYTQKLFNLTLGQQLKFEVKNPKDRFTNILNGRAPSKEVIFQIVGFNDTYQGISFFTNQYVANKILGLNLDYGFNGIYSSDLKNTIPAQINRVIGVYSPSGVYNVGELNSQNQNMLELLNVMGADSKDFWQIPDNTNLLKRLISGVNQTASGTTIIDTLAELFGINSNKQPLVVNLVDQQTLRLINQQLNDSVNQVLVFLICLFIPMVVVVVFVISANFFEELRKMSIIMKTLGFTNFENALNSLIYFGVVLLLTLSVSVPISIGLIFGYVLAIFNILNTLLVVKLQLMFFVYATISLSGLFLLSFVYSYVRFRAVYLPLGLKEV